ncbi:Carboxylesterase patB [Hyphodiscus hymeniophilus]|uniref:Carboxylic ester hydrolase n=1 Tax=Hyphodiscus hymeniophilus TaxID=353542 RepID=A0A9P7AYD7_9HELO|nr:Carboxylesterase patB [Hyphodiscus hymeniophilus]
MFRLQVFLVLGIFSFLIDYSDALLAKLPIVDLGYELHQATFDVSGQYYNFSNIRYAAPPLGNLRFAAPTSPTGRVFNDGSKAVTCIEALPAWGSTTADWLVNGTAAFDISAGYQPPNITTMPPQDLSASEDCLFLDLMVPKTIFDKAGRGPAAPVMVWIHGGGYTLGSKTLYSPSATGLIRASQSNGKEGVIWVGLNYRLGIFGFLSGPTFQASGTANAGLHDQRFALEWVQQNIHKFGGDPNQVTLIGESAGGGSTMHQITAYGGLKGKVPFQQAIVQSPGFQPMPSTTGQEAVYNEFLSKADPAVDGDFVPALPGKLLLQGGFDKSLKIMAGHNLDEGISFEDAYAQDEERFEADFRIYFPTITDAEIQYISKVLYPPVFDGSYGYTSYTLRGDYWVTEAFFTCSTNYLARAYGSQTYNYIFSVPPSLHGDDIPYTYFSGPNPSVKNDTLAVIMQEYFTNFAITGSPNGPGLPHFPQYGSSSTVQNLGLSSIGPVPDNVANPRCLWWQKGLYA